MATLPILANRLHHWDAARALFMLLGIPFHAALAYDPAGHWLVRSPEHSAFLGAFAFVVQSFRMPGFFLIAGFFAAVLLARRGRASWLRTRFVRLGVPFLTAMVVLVPVQTLALAGYASGGGMALFNPHGPNPFDYLWFLPSLLLLCVLLAVIWKPLCKLAARPAIASRLGSPNIWPILGLLAGGWLVLMQLYPMLIGTKLIFAHGLVDFHHMLENVPWFFAGILCGIAPQLRVQLERRRWSTLAIGLAALTVYAVTDGAEARAIMALTDVAAGVAALCLVASLFALLARRAAHPSDAVRRWVDASFTIYLLHHPIIVLLAIACLSIEAPPVTEWAAITMLTLGISYGAHRIVARSPLALFLLNGIPLGRRGRPGLVVPAGPQPEEKP